MVRNQISRRKLSGNMRLALYKIRFKHELSSKIVIQPLYMVDAAVKDTVEM